MTRLEALLVDPLRERWSLEILETCCPSVLAHPAAAARAHACADTAPAANFWNIMLGPRHTLQQGSTDNPIAKEFPLLLVESGIPSTMQPFDHVAPLLPHDRLKSFPKFGSAISVVAAGLWTACDAEFCIMAFQIPSQDAVMIRAEQMRTISFSAGLRMLTRLSATSDLV